MPDCVLRLERTTYRYPTHGEPALDAVTLAVEEGEFVLLAGRSASGKSTLLRAAAGLVPHFFGGEFAGRVVVGGRDTRDCGPAAIATVAASVFQDPESQIVMNTVRSELELPLESRGTSPAVVARAVEEGAIALGIDDLLERAVHTLSGGELQRVALAAALAGQPRLVLLDEPTSQLDPVAGDELIWQLRRLNEEWGTTVVLSEQRIERCLAAADRVVALERGRVAFDGVPREFATWACAAAPELAPPVARMCDAAGVLPVPVGVRDGRALLRENGLAVPPEQGSSAALSSGAPSDRAGAIAAARRLLVRRRRPGSAPALRIDRVWAGYDDPAGGSVTALRGASLSVAPGEAVALIGRNGAGKSTLLRIAAGLRTFDRGRVEAAGDVALLVQTPADYFLHERVKDELPARFADAALADVGLSERGDADPRDLSGGERQRLALAIVLAGRGVGGGRPPSVVALDEPTRGLDRSNKEALAHRLRALAEEGSGVVVATHDVEFAARLATRCVLMGQGRVIAEGDAREILSGGRYFTTEVARVLGPQARAVLPEDGARVVRELALARDAAGPRGSPKLDREQTAAASGRR